MLELPAPVISNIRHRRIPIGAVMLVTIHEATGISIANLKACLSESGKTTTHESMTHVKESA